MVYELLINFILHDDKIGKLKMKFYVTMQRDGKIMEKICRAFRKKECHQIFLKRGNISAFVRLENILNNIIMDRT